MNYIVRLYSTYDNQIQMFSFCRDFSINEKTCYANYIDMLGRYHTIDLARYRFEITLGYSK